MKNEGIHHIWQLYRKHALYPRITHNGVFPCILGFYILLVNGVISYYRVLRNCFQIFIRGFPRFTYISIIVIHTHPTINLLVLLELRRNINE